MAKLSPKDGVHFGVAQLGAFIRCIHRRQVGRAGFAAVGAYRGCRTEVGLVFCQLAVQPVGQVGTLLQFGARGGGDFGHPTDDMVASVLAAVDANPATLMLVRRHNGSGAAGEWVKRQVAGVAAGQDDALVQR